MWWIEVGVTKKTLSEAKHEASVSFFDNNNLEYQ